MAKKKTGYKMTDEHKEQLARGREQGKVVRRYLEELESRSNTRNVDPEKLEAELQKATAAVDEAESPVDRVEAIQRRIDVEQRLVAARESESFEDLEKQFIDAVGEYAERKGISYTAWREQGVPAAVLKQAGVPRTRRKS